MDPMERLTIVDFERDGAPARFTVPYSHGSHVVSGCEVVASDHAAFSLDVAPGVVMIHGQPVAVAAQTVQIRMPIAGGHHRLSLVVVDGSGRASVLEGSDSNHPSYPSVSAGVVALAGVLVESRIPAIEHITAEQIADKRALR